MHATMHDRAQPGWSAESGRPNRLGLGRQRDGALRDETLGTATTTYGYDSLYRVTSVNDPSGTTSYSYEPVGNRLSKVLGSTTSYSYDKANRIPNGRTFRLYCCRCGTTGLLHPPIESAGI